MRFKVMLMYTPEDIKVIYSNVKNGKLSFSLKIGASGYKAYFGKQGKNFIQRIDNFMLGLAYLPELDAMVPNYPHLNNMNEKQNVEIRKDIGCYYTYMTASEKLNGTNLGMVLPLVGGVKYDNRGQIIARCRGSIEPEIFMNSINSIILTGQKNYVGVKPEAFTSFIEKYTPILNEGQAKGLVDSFGNFNLSKITPELKEKLRPVFADYPTIIGVFGELISKFNPIAIDGELRYGMYIDSEKDWDWVIFDVMKMDEDGNIYLDSNVKFMEAYGFKTVKTIPLKDIERCLEDFSADEGVIVKGWNGQYLKVKHDVVIEWARTQGKLSTIINSAIDHIFSQGLGFTKEEVLEELVLKDADTKASIINSIWVEIEGNGISRKNLEDYYIEHKLSPKQVDFDLLDKLNINLMMLVASILKDAGISKETLYKEIPKYLMFEREPLFYDIEKQKWRANAWYVKMLAQTIGRMFLSPKTHH